MTSSTPETLTPRRRAILDAAVTVVATSGMRGLTHRAVDRAADLPEGTTSAYLRTRRALQLALATHVAAGLGADVDRVVDRIAPLADGDRAALDALVGMFSDWLARPDLLLAKVELTLEAARDLDLAAVLAVERDRVVRLVAGVLDDHGHDRPTARAETMVASLDGVLLSALGRRDDPPSGFLAEALTLLVPGVERADA